MISSNVITLAIVGTKEILVTCTSKPEAIDFTLLKI